MVETDSEGNVVKPKYSLISTHSARRSGITNLYKSRLFNTRQLMSISGHKTESSFYLYISESADELADEIAAIMANAKKESNEELFNLLCEQYKLKEAHEGYWLLKDFFEHRIKGEAFTDEEIASDFTAMEIASMLLLLRGKIKFKIEADHGCSITITDKRMIESLVGYLNMELNKRVNKRGNIVEVLVHT